MISFFSWPEVARIVRSQALSVVNLPYMDAARVLGGRHPWILRRHLLPAVAPVITVTVVLTASRAVIAEAGLSFLGMGDPNSWSWGRILYESQQSGSMTSAWWTTFFPSVAILAARRRGHADRHRLQRRPQPPQQERLTWAFTSAWTPRFYESVQRQARTGLEAAGLDGIVLDHPDDVAYLTGFFHHPCERPVVAYIGKDEPTVLLVPALEREHAAWQHAAGGCGHLPRVPGGHRAAAGPGGSGARQSPGSASDPA